MLSVRTSVMIIWRENVQNSGEKVQMYLKDTLSKTRHLNPEKMQMHHGFVTQLPTDMFKTGFMRIPILSPGH